MGRFEQKKKSSPWILILVAAGVIAAAVAVWAVFFRTQEAPPVLAPEMAPQEEQQAETIPEDTGEKLESPQGGGSVSISYAREVDVDLNTGKVTLQFANPGKSNQDMVLQILVQDAVIVQTGNLRPGTQVTELELLAGTGKNLSPGSYEGLFKILFYHPETGEMAPVNAEIPVEIRVTK
jgi:hypothetical protein